MTIKLALILALIPVLAAADKLPIISGNFSVNHIQHSPIGAWPEPNWNGEPVPGPDNWAMHKKSGLMVYEDYVAWGAVELEPGKWDWSRQIEVATNQIAGGFEYDAYLWLMNPPAWMREGELPTDDPDAPDHYTLMKCLEHGEETYTLSIWDPATVKWFGRWYKHMARALGDKLGRTYVALPGPYGEGNYPLPIPDWVKIGHSHEGYWCGDPYALKAFIASFRKQYKTLPVLNDAWGTDFARWDDVDFPPEIKAGKLLKAGEYTDAKARRRWIDFIKWYHQSIIDFSVDVTNEAEKYIPIEKLKMKPGGSAGGVNPIAWGTYCPGYAKAVAKWHMRLQPADCHGRPFGDRWYGTAYRFCGIPFTTEPAGGLDQRTFLRRVFMDASNGASEMFSYEWEKHKADGVKWIHLYRGMPSITDVAVYCPTTWYRMNGDIWPVIRTADSLRDITDFEVADELLIEDDYLTKSNIRVLIWLGGSVTERVVLEKILKWVEDGGILVWGCDDKPTDVEGRTDISDKLFRTPVAAEAGFDFGSLGRGLVMSLPDQPDRTNAQTLSDVVITAVYRVEAHTTREPAPEIDSRRDDVWTALFPDIMLLYNNGDKPADVERTWEDRTYKVRLEPGELVEIDLQSGEVKR